MKRFSFTKMAAAGNDFIVFDNRGGVLKVGARHAAVTWCDRKRSVGADGLLVLETSRKANYRMRILNPDGSQAAMCGNGVRCLARFAVARGIAKAKHRIETGAGLIEASVQGKVVKAHLTDPKDLRVDVALTVAGRREKVNFIDTGVPHAVIFDPSLAAVSVNERGRQIRVHKYFAPKGTNVNFVKVGNHNTIEVRTYERGVEAETLACGTGSTASALVAAARKGLRSPVKVKTSGGEILNVYFKNKNGRWKDVYLEGPVETTFEGSVLL